MWVLALEGVQDVDAYERAGRCQGCLDCAKSTYPFCRLEERTDECTTLQGGVSGYPFEETVEAVKNKTLAIPHATHTYSSLRRSINSGLKRSPVRYSMRG